MKKYSNSEKKILKFLQKRLKEEYHVNELIRATGLLPRSVSLAIDKLENRGFITSRRIGNLRLISINEAKLISEFEQKSDNQTIAKITDWINISLPEFPLNLQMELITSLENNLLENEKLTNFFYSPLTEKAYVSKVNFEKLKLNLQPKLFFGSEEFTNSAYIKLNHVEDFINNLQLNELPNFSNEQIGSILVNLQKHLDSILFYVLIGKLFEDDIIRHLQTEQGLTYENIKSLFEPVNIAVFEYINLLKVIQRIYEWATFKEVDELIESHAEQYANWNYLDAISQKDNKVHVYKQIQNLMAKEKYPKQRIETITAKRNEAKLRHDNLVQRLNLTQQSKALVKFVQDYYHIQLQTYSSISKLLKVAHPLFNEIAIRFKIDSECIKLLTFDELSQALQSVSARELINDLAVKLNQRNEYYALVINDNGEKIITGLNSIVNYMIRHGLTTETIYGKSVYPGNVIGYTKNETDFVHCKGDSILLAQKDVEYSEKIVSNAKAIITESDNLEDSVIKIAREFGIPCIAGVKIGDKLKPKQYVYLNASEAKVVIIGSEINNEFKGRLTHGEAYGKVFFRDSIEPEDILVSSMILPNYLTQLLKAKAFIVEEENLMSLSNFYSYALEMPALIGAKDATKNIQPHQKVRVG